MALLFVPQYLLTFSLVWQVEVATVPCWLALSARWLMRAEDALVAAAVVATHYLSFAVSAKSVVEHGPSIKPKGLFNKLELSILV